MKCFLLELDLVEEELLCFSKLEQILRFSFKVQPKVLQENIVLDRHFKNLIPLLNMKSLAKYQLLSGIDRECLSEVLDS